MDTAEKLQRKIIELRNMLDMLQEGMPFLGSVDTPRLEELYETLLEADREFQSVKRRNEELTRTVSDLSWHIQNERK